MKRLILALLLTCLAVIAFGCGGDSESDSEGDAAATQTAASSSDSQATASPSDEGSGDSVEQSSSADDSEEDSDSGQSSASSDDDSDSGQSSASSDDDSDSGQSSASSGYDDSEGDANGDSGEHDSDDDVVAYENPGAEGTPFDSSRNDALDDAQPLDAVTWTAGPTLSLGALDASGTLSEGAMLFDPTVDGEGAAFILYFKGVPEPLLVILPNLGPMYIWDTDHTVAEMDYEFEGSTFTFSAYSPLFFDTGPGDLELRVYGYDAAGNDALLAVTAVE